MKIKNVGKRFKMTHDNGSTSDRGLLMSSENYSKMKISLKSPQIKQEMNGPKLIYSKLDLTFEWILGRWVVPFCLFLKKWAQKLCGKWLCLIWNIILVSFLSPFCISGRFLSDSETNTSEQYQYDEVKLSIQIFPLWNYTTTIKTAKTQL